MDVRLTTEETRFKVEAEKYFSSLVTADQREALRRDEYGEAYKQICKKLGADGWLGVGWPEKFGGRGMDGMADNIVVSAAFRHHVPFPLMPVYSIGPALQRFGTPSQQSRFLPEILSGERSWAIGYSEVGAGTDLASLETTATREGDGYVVRGHKMWTSGMHGADYMWLACRTDSTRARHRGISILVVDAHAPGVSWTPIRTLNRSHQVNVTYLDGVRVPADMLVGEENGGWKVIGDQLTSERFIVGPAGKLEAHLDRFRHWAETGRTYDDRPLSENGDVRRMLADITATTTVSRVLNWRIIADTGSGAIRPADAAANKIQNSEALVRLGREAAAAVQRYGDPADQISADTFAGLDFALKSELKLPVGGGVNEIQREMLATLGLGLPRAPR